MEFKDVDLRTEHGKLYVDSLAKKLHPKDKVTFYRDVAVYATEKAAKQEETNDRDGTPE